MWTRVSPAILLVAAALSTVDAQGRTPILEGIEVRVPSAPMSLQVDGSRVLAWEVHLTNTRADTLRLRSLVVHDESARTVTSFDETALARWTLPVTRGPSPTPTTVMPPGVRRVVHAWVTLPSPGNVPRTIAHRITVATTTSEFVVSSGAVPVSTERPVEIAPPLRGGPWVAIYDPALPGGHRTAIYTVDGRARIPARFAIDFVKLPATGTFDSKATAADRNGFGADVLAVGDGTVVAAVDDMPDNDDALSVPRPRFPIEAGSGNYVAIDLGRGRFAFYEHLKSHSITVRAGQKVRAGQVIAQLGYSGSSSIGPHLHFHVADANSLLGSEGVPVAFQAFRNLGAFADISSFVAGARFVDAPDTTMTQRRGEMPRANAVVMFR